jgi:phosphoglycerol transferase MdoB-like AlkP superfamily enzyme|tara:strand:- start:2611 stop:4524 length:1914 start_codon:yes stop_codon:yes gene_type:complete
MNYRIQEIKVLSYRILLVFLFYTSFRLLFIYFNNDILKLTSFGNVLELCYYGLRFDSVAIVYSNLIFLLLSILPLTQITSNGYQKFLFGVYFIFNGIGMMINFIDLEYYRFNLNRMMSSVFEVVKFETNKTTLFFHFLYTHFHLLLIYMFLFVLWIWLYNKIVIDPNKIVKIRNYIISSVLFFLTVSTLAVMGVRGGDLKKSTRPITLIDAMDHVDNPLHADVVLNSLFTIIRTLNQEDFKIRDQFNEDELTEVLNPIKSYNRDWDTKPNVVIFILESMGREYWGSMNQKTQIPNYISYTPFLDSLAQHSLIYPNAFATSRKSIHGMPSVLAGIPSFKLSYASSSYAKQKIQSVVSLANELDYETSFFHGAANGSMGFQGFSNTLGFDEYYGRNEFNDDSEFDGYWGIWDEPFLQFMSSELDKKKRPFLSTVFTVSSHEPYIIPKKYMGKFEVGNIQMHQCVRYTDFALRRFFEKSKNSSWFKNTIFIFTADHGNQTFYPFYEKTINRFANPLMIYQTESTLIGVDERLTSHMDIYPTVADLMGYQKPFRSWGMSLMNAPSDASFVMNFFGGGSYFIMDDEYICVHNGKKATGFYLAEDKNLEKNLISKRNKSMDALEKKGSMFLQDYFNRIISGDM